MTNGAKLILIVLGFFLALTYVRGFTLNADTDQVVFLGNQPIAFPVSITNTSTVALKPNFLADGPFTIILPADVPLVPGNDSKTYERPGRHAQHSRRGGAHP